MPVHVPAVPPLIQLPAYVYGKTAEADPTPGALHPYGKPRQISWHISSSLQTGLTRVMVVNWGMN